MIGSKFIGSAVVALCLFGGAANAQTVKIAQGSLRGVTEGGVEAFKNIPFAAPPVGPLRWKAPQPAAAWKGVRDATKHGNACMQLPVGGSMGDDSAIGYALGDQGPFTQSEDCLNLIVRRPAGTKAGAKLPVMIWIYGGGFEIGNGAQRTYNGSGLLKRNVILVNPNYRLGTFGFLAHPDLSAETANHVSGNYAMLDAIAAMKWVKANIAAFGGDPNNVTIFGESAGAATVSFVTGSPLAKGLFNRSIIQSTGQLFGPRDLSLADAEKAGSRWTDHAGVKSIAAARALTAEQVLAASRPAPDVAPFPHRPVVDGWFLPTTTYEQLKNGAYNKPVIVGNNNDEGVVGFSAPTLALADYVAMVRRNWGADADTILAAYPATNDREALRSARDLSRDSSFASTTWAWAKGQRAAPVYTYNFNHRPPFPKAPHLDDVNAAHAVELPYTMGEIFSTRMNWKPEDYALSEKMIGYWTNFAKTGNPNGPGLPEWTVSGPAGDRSMQFGGPALAAMGETRELRRLAIIDEIYRRQRAAAAAASAGK
ncbi:carboxylesterase family protein [Sphingobium sp. H39-3-25]|uniref:carboxylesterase/lipase family protein n=1 Tax=Sphingobium arseniciresistens TaxID=3030834 RepID=UPI0023B97E2F|nr:carboxylesterase family protein [Sphingobium arseniciresistens]